MTIIAQTSSQRSINLQKRAPALPSKAKAPHSTRGGEELREGEVSWTAKAIESLIQVFAGAGLLNAIVVSDIWFV